MYQRPMEYMEILLGLHPQLVIVHAEAEGDFIGFAEVLHRNGIEAGVALLPQTPVETIASSLENIDHVLICFRTYWLLWWTCRVEFAKKIQQLKVLKPQLEIGWDGGVNEQNVIPMVKAGVEVINAGGYIHGASDPQAAYAKLQSLAEGWN